MGGGEGGPSTCPPWRQRDAWVEFVVGSLPCSESSFSGNPVLPLLNNEHIQFQIRARAREAEPQVYLRVEYCLKYATRR